MMIRILTVISFIIISFTANADIEKGKSLHDGSCTSCHINIQGGDGSGIYTRENKRITSHPALIKQVKRCRDSLGVAWPEQHVNDVVEYLNNSYYKF